MERYADYVERMLAQGHRLPLMLRHVQGLYAGLPNARAWRRYLTEHGDPARRRRRRAAGVAADVPRGGLAAWRCRPAVHAASGATGHTRYNVKSIRVDLPAHGRPGVLPSVTSTETEVAVLFADVVGSTRLYELLGDQRARELIQLCVEIMREATERNRGTVIKTIGDEILAIFPTADDAVNAGGEMQQDIGARPELLVQGQHVAIRIGCHFGPVVLENKDIFGASVHTANRMTSQAKAGQIILSAETVRRCSPEWRAVVAPRRRHARCAA